MFFTGFSFQKGFQKLNFEFSQSLKRVRNTSGLLFSEYFFIENFTSILKKVAKNFFLKKKRKLMTLGPIKLKNLWCIFKVIHVFSIQMSLPLSFFFIEKITHILNKVAKKKFFFVQKQTKVIEKFKYVFFLVTNYSYFKFLFFEKDNKNSFEKIIIV